MRLAFLGTPDFAVPALRALAPAHDVVRVYTQPARPAGRGKAPRPSPVARAAAALGLEVETPDRFADPDVTVAFEDLRLDAAVVVAYGQILKPRALAAPRLGCLNLHASLLPRWRGAAPIHRAVMAGDRETGVTVMQMEPGLDTGPVLAELRVPIAPTDTTGDLHDRLAALGAELMARTLPRLGAGGLAARPQPEAGVTYAAKIDKAEARIDWADGAASVAAKVNGLSPFPGAWTTLGATRLKLLRAEPAAGSGTPGEALDDRLRVACGSGAVRILHLQRESRAAQEAATFLAGQPVPAGTRFI